MADRTPVQWYKFVVSSTFLGHFEPVNDLGYDIPPLPPHKLRNMPITDLQRKEAMSLLDEATSSWPADSRNELTRRYVADIDAGAEFPRLPIPWKATPKMQKSGTTLIDCKGHICWVRHSEMKRMCDLCPRDRLHADGSFVLATYGDGYYFFI
jgi:hypothetical protein